MDRAELARLLRAVGLVCAIGALVVGHQGDRYWDDGSLSAFVLALTIPAGLGIGVAFAFERPGLDRLSLPLGSLLAGLFLFVPVSIAATGGDVSASEALGICVSLVPLSLLVARPRRRAGAAVVAGLLPTIGSVPLLVAVWPDAIAAGGRGYSYWSWPTYGHAFGIALLVLALGGLAAVALFLHGGRLGAESAVSLAALGGGYGLYIPVVGAFGFDFLTTGVWLGAAGGLVLLAAGILTALRR